MKKIKDIITWIIIANFIFWIIKHTLVYNNDGKISIIFDYLVGFYLIEWAFNWLKIK